MLAAQLGHRHLGVGWQAHGGSGEPLWKHGGATGARWNPGAQFWGGILAKARAHRVSISSVPSEQKVTSIPLTSNSIRRFPNLLGIKNNSRARCSRSKIGRGGASEEKAGCSPTCQPCCGLWPQVALRSLGSVVSSVPAAWHLPVPASSSLGVGDVSEQRKGSLGW